MGDAADWLTDAMFDPDSDDEYEMWDDRDNDDEDDGEPIGSCDECETNLYVDDEYHWHGLRLCGQCYWWMTRA